MRTHVDLFSGIGGFSLACQWAGVETIAFAEIDPYASRVLQRHWPQVRNYGEVRGFPSLSAWLLTAGVPCQPASVAGKRQGAADDRWLWPQTLAVVENGSYEWLLFENPTGILSLNDGLEFEGICAAVESKGYEVQPLVIPACAIGAPHRRDRVWIIAHRNQDRRAMQNIPVQQWRQDDAGNQSDGNGTTATNRAEFRWHEAQTPDSPAGGSQLPGQARGFGCGAIGNEWLSEPDICRVVDGLSAEMVAAIGALGNAIVPQVAYQLIKRMIEAEEP